ncbi:MAG: protein kinase [Elusimicrobiales bacterium]|nr:protein kinase [Elusimicrobiales bacterium]
MKAGKTACEFARAALALAALLCCLDPAPAAAADRRAEEQAGGLYRSGLSAYAKGDYTAAIIALSKAYGLDPELEAEIEPRLAAAYSKRGYAAYSRGDYSRALADFEALLRMRPQSADVRRMHALIQEKLRGGPRDPAVAVRRGLLRIAELEEMYKLRHGQYTSDARALAELSIDMNGLKAQLAEAVIPGSLAIESNGEDFLVSADVRAPGRPRVSVAPADVAAFAANIKAREENRPGAFRQLFDILSFVVGLLILAVSVPWAKVYRGLARFFSASGQTRPPAPRTQGGAAPAGPPPPPGVFSEAAAAARAGKYQEALAALLKKPQSRMTLTDYCLLFEIYLQLGDFVRAGLVLSTIDREIAAAHPVSRGPGGAVFEQRRLKGALPPDPAASPEALPATFMRLARLADAKTRPDLAWQLDRLAADCLLTTLAPAADAERYYELAGAFEAAGSFERAIELYGLVEHGDSAERRERLKARVVPGPPRPPAAPRPAPPAGAPPARVAPAPAITLAGRYELRSTVAAGGMGIIYEGLDRKSGLTVAVKQMHSYLKEYPEEYERFRKEAAIVDKLNHPNIVALYNLIEQDGEIYLVFEYVAGKTLHALLKEKKRLTLEDCKTVFAGTCDAVHYAHANGVIHRDLKPPNIMLADTGKAMVMDFGLACTLRDGLTRVSHQTSSGTPAYMAPEQHSGVVKRESDIYSMGVCLYEMLTGSLPYTGLDNQKQKLLKDYREAGSLLPWLPPGVDALISRALEPEPTMRYADALDFWDELKGL